jgi:hypothetical protein
VQIQESFFKTHFIQGNERVSNDDFRPGIETLAEAEDLIDSSETYWNVGLTLCLGGPLMLLHGLSATADNYEAGQKYIAGGTILSAAGVYLVHMSARNRAEAGEISNNDKTTEKPTPRLWLSPILANGNTGGVLLKMEF